MPPNPLMGRVFSQSYMHVLFVLFLFGIFGFWVLSVLLPITVVEATYQYKKLLRDTFRTTSMRGLILPTISFDITGASSRHTDNGITIPAIFVDEPIIFNVDPNDEKAYREALRQGIAHASSTAFPGLPGLGYYFAHSSSPEFVSQYNAVFYLLGKLQPGDNIFIWHEGKRHEFVVTKKEETAPSDISFLTRSYETDTIVLQTCWPPATTQRRLLVFAERSDK